MKINQTIFFLIIVLIPFLGLLVNGLFFNKNRIKGSWIAVFSVWLGFVNLIIAWLIGVPFSEKLQYIGFIANETSWLMSTLILFVSGIVHFFSIRYLAGDRNYHRYFLLLTSITISALLMVISDNIISFISFWFMSNLILVLLMIHKSNWNAAKNSGIIALKTFFLGLVFLSIGIGLLAYESKTFSLTLIAQNNANFSSYNRIIALLFIMLAVFTQSGVWPFHNWLISSLNSPTPVSSLMHAGLVNGGGFLLTRFALVFLNEKALLNSLFLFGFISLFLGGIYKLIQSDIKRMLACSTMSQMGFMIMQCGLGLFPAALTHLCYHGLFKAFLFLCAGSSLTEEKHSNDKRKINGRTFILACFCGIIGTIGFTLTSHYSLVFKDTTTILVIFSWIATTQIAQVVLQKKQSLFFVLATSILCLIMNILYGTTVNVIERTVVTLGISQPQTLNFMHVLSVSLVICVWALINLKNFASYEKTVWWRRVYVRALNASQPNPNTVTLRRTDYKF